MSFQVLPNWCKKLGVIVFVFFSFLEGRDAFFEGFLGVPEKSLQSQGVFSFRAFFGEDLMLVFSVASLLGMIMYMFSKEKIEDDFINKLRLESYQLTALLIIIVSLIFYVSNFGTAVELGTFISLFLFVYLLIFAVKKRIV